MRDRKHTMWAILVLIFSVAGGGAEAATRAGAFEGAATLADGSQVAIVVESLRSGQGKVTNRGVVTVDGRNVDIACAEVHSVPSELDRTLGTEGFLSTGAHFTASGVDADGRFVLVRAVDGGPGGTDQAGVSIGSRPPRASSPDCGAGGVRIQPVDLGQFIGGVVDLPVDLTPLLPPPSVAPSPSLRLLTYNAAFLYLEADGSSLPPPPAPPCPSCDPLELAPAPCACYPEITIWPNHGRFANLGDVERAQKIAERILATDQDIVVLIEVFNPAIEEAFVAALSGGGPYDHYVKGLAGKPAVELESISDAVEFFAGDIPDFLEAIHPDVSSLTGFQPVPGTSGLMLFSKYRFLELTGSNVVDDTACGGTCRAEGQSDGAPLAPGTFAFDVFDHCEPRTADCLASKGVGLVKIDTPAAPTYVAFTHMQADYPGDGIVAPVTRAKQFEAIRDVILGSIPAGEITGATVYLAGDLNVVGAARDAAFSADNAEWRSVFHPDASVPNVADGFFACGNGVETSQGTDLCSYPQNGSRKLTDAWGFETSTTDAGLTNPTDHARLDYVVHSSAENQCMQHATIAWDLQADPGNGGVTWLSDHLPVRTDSGTAARWCSPNDDPEAALPFRNVRILQFGPTNCGASGPNPTCEQDEVVSPPEAAIGPPGAFQWFRIDVSGSYSIKLTGPGVRFDVYHHTDLSRPIEPFEEEEGELGIPYSMPEAPYYIRTYAVDANGSPDRTASNLPYTLAVHQHLCRSPLDACMLDPGLADVAPYEYVWPTVVDPLSEVRELWWRFKTSGVDGGRLSPNALMYPTVQFQIEAFPYSENYTCVTRVEPTIERWDDHMAPVVLEEEIAFESTEVDPDDHDWDDDGFIDDYRTAPDLPGKVPDELQVYFVKLTRDADGLASFEECNAGMTSWISYLTDLTYFVPTDLLMWAELDDDIGAEDNLAIRMGWDEGGPTPGPNPSESQEIAIEEPSSGFAHQSLHGFPILRGYYTRQMWPTLYEIDEGALLHPWDATFDGFPPLDPREVSAPRKAGDSAPFVQFSDGPNGDEADYYYYLRYKRCHVHTEPLCANP
jgi:hypothetical protein